MPDLKLELEPSPRMAKLASFELELEYSSRPDIFKSRLEGVGVVGGHVKSRGSNDFKIRFKLN